MKKSTIKKLSLALVLVMMLSLCSCDWFNYEEPNDPWAYAVITEDCELGEGAKTVQVQVVVEEHSVTFTIHTNAKTLGEALAEHGIVEGEDSQYGLYINMVNGIIADYDIDGSYWGFYQNGEYMMSGVDTTDIVGGEHFELVYEK